MAAYKCRLLGKLKQKTTTILLVVLSLLLIIAVPTSLSSSDNLQYGDIEPKISEELAKKQSVDIIVVLKEATDETARAGLTEQERLELRNEKIRENQEKVLSTLADADFRAKHKYKTINAFAGSVTLNGFNKLKINPNVKSIELDREVHISMAESAPLIDANNVWNIRVNNINITGEGETVCVIDTGIDYAHVDLGGCLGTNCKVMGGYDFVNSDSNPIDDNGHGTHVAGTVASTNSVYKGVAPGSKLIAMKVLDAAGSGSFSNAVAAIDWCVNNKTKFNISVISMSLGDSGQYNNPSTCDGFSAGISINTAVREGIFVSVSSGNNGYTNGISYPACVTNATSVGAVYDASLGSVGWSACTDTTTAADKFACFTNRDEILDVLAPGYAIYSTKMGGGFTTKGGTSMAAPHVAGAAALLQQYSKKVNSNALKPSEIDNLLKTKGKSVYDSAAGLSFPRINVSASVNSIQVNCIDSDGDGYSPTNLSCGPVDCNDNNADINQGAAEICNNVDDNCDGVIDEGSDTICRFEVKDNLGNIMAWFGYATGNVWINGALEQSSSHTATGNDELRFQDSSGNDVMIVDNTNGNMYLKGTLSENQNTLNPTSGDDNIIIKNGSNIVVAYINKLGNMFLKGTLTGTATGTWNSTYNNGLVSYHAFNNFDDSVNSAYHLTNNTGNIKIVADGKNSNAASSANVTAGNWLRFNTDWWPIIDTAGQASISFWAKQIGECGDVGVSYASTMIGRGSVSGDYSNYFALDYMCNTNSTNLVWGSSIGPSWVLNQVSGTVGRNTWHNYFIEINKTHIGYWIDNSLAYSSNSLNSAGVNWAANDSYVFRGLGSNKENANVTLDELAIWNRFLSDGERTGLYNSGNGLFYAP